MLVYTMSHGELWTTVFCSYCSREMGRFTVDEVTAMMRDWQGAICFDCQGETANVVYPAFRMADEPEALVIDGEVFRVDSWGGKSWTDGGRIFERKNWGWLRDVRLFSWGFLPLSSTSKRSADVQE